MKDRLQLRLRLRLAWATLLLVAATVFGCRLLGPGDLYKKDQPKTITYTADLVLNGRWVLPRDVLYQPATKPPLYNWLAAAGVRASGSWAEFWHKWPSVAAAAGTAGLLLWAFRGRGVLAPISPPTESGRGRPGSEIGVAAACVFLTAGIDAEVGSVAKLLYVARPDMLQAFFLTGAWLAATAAVRRPTARGAAGPAAWFWACVAMAAMSKGPAAVLPVAYALLAAPLLGGSWRRTANLWLPVGLPLAAMPIGLWLLAAYRADPSHTLGTILGAEVVARIGSEHPGGPAGAWYLPTLWFGSKFLPWSAVTLAALLAVGWRVARTGSVRDDAAARRPVIWASAAWLGVVLVAFSLPAGKRVDYLLPALPPMAVLSSWAMVGTLMRLRLPVALAAVATLPVAGYVAWGQVARSVEARERWTDRTAAFARDVRRVVPAGEPVLVLVRGKHPLWALLGVHQGSFLTPADLRAARWVVMPVVEGATAEVTSEPVLVEFTLGSSPRSTARSERLGLYRADAPGGVGYDELRRAEREAASWKHPLNPHAPPTPAGTEPDNPYFSPGTVWRDERTRREPR